MFMYVNVDLKLQRQYPETWIFRMLSGCVRQGKYLLDLGKLRVYYQTAMEIYSKNANVMLQRYHDKLISIIGI